MKQQNEITRHIILFFSLCFLLAPTAFSNGSFKTIQWHTTNGVPVIFYPTMDVPMLDISIAFAAGSAYDGEKHGLSALTTRLLNQGNHGLDAHTIAERLAETGAQFAASNSQNMVVLSLRTLINKQALNVATNTFTLIITRPDFPEASFHQEKKQQLMGISQAKESPDTIANETFFQVLYQDHPYAHPIAGDSTHVEQLTVEDVRHFYQQYFVDKNAILVLVGAINRTTAEQLAEQISKDLPNGQKAPEIPMAQSSPKELDIEVQFPSSQTIVRLGQLGITHDDKHFFPLIVGNYILGGGSIVSRLSLELREKRGLTYSVFSQLSPMPGDGPLIIGLSTKNSQTKTAIDVTRDTLATFIKTGPTEQEVVAAKQYLTGSYPLSLASNRSIADMLLKIAFFKLPDDYLQNYVSHINAVSTAQIKKAFQELIHPNQLLQVSVGKGEQSK
jgi:zinc protease